VLESLSPKHWSIIIVLAIGVLAILVIRISSRLVLKKYKEKIHPGKKFVFFQLMFTFSVGVVAPTLEEAVFRGPILFFFNDFGFWAWLFIIVQAIAFGMMHARGNILTKILVASGDPEFKVHGSKIAGCARVVVTGILGLFCGYLVIKYQSLYYGVILHACFNSLVALLFGVLPLLVMIPKISRMAEFETECRKCGWKDVSILPDDGLEKVIEFAANRHAHVIGEKCKYPEFSVSSPKGKYFCVPGLPPVHEGSVYQQTQPTKPEPTVLRELPFDEFLRNAINEWANQNNGQGEVSGQWPAYTVILTQKDEKIFKQSTLEYQIEPSENVWQISVNGKRLIQNSAQTSTGARFNIKYSYVIGEEDIDNPFAIIQKIINHF
jgi:membrane protease YdiL (CAAX protease family)/predicted nucleic-acid-binding Zn-ribbon protein